MSQVCSKCSRVNPADAAYCYYDGVILAGHSVNGGPVNPGTAPFPSQFVFPSGLTVKNFDQFALACQNNWQSAVDLMKQGFLSSFLGGLGRADLALAAQEAARFPDQDRGLDQLLAKLPTQVLEAPKLKVEPSEVNLGHVPMGNDGQFELHLGNQGMRLVYGSVVSDSKWLTLGESPGSPQKLFQFGGQAAIPVHIRGQHLRAGNKPLEGHLTIESNGGSVTVLVRAEVPVKPFTEGVLAGAISPRQVAEKALKQPKEAAPWFEQGAVAKWFTTNGWTYPVQGPSASGMGAVQQFFEALGLTKAPKVEVTTPSLNLRGAPGASLHATIEVKTPEKRPVYAHATCDQSWVDASRTKLNGRFATINVAIKSVPNRPGEALQAKIHVTGNGNQRFIVPLTLAIEGSSPFADMVALEPTSGDSAHLMPVSAGAPLELVEAVAVPAMADLPAPSLPATSASAFVNLNPSPPAAGPALLVPQSTGVMARPAPAAVISPRRRPQGKPLWAHLLPLIILFLALAGILIRDLVKKPGPAFSESQEGDLRIGLYFDFSNNADEVKKHKLGQTMKFGMVKVDDPHNPKDFKRITYDYRGGTNSTLVKIDGENKIFAHPATGRWEPRPFVPRKVRGMSAPWMFVENVLVTQTVQIIDGEPIELGPGVYKSMLDTCLIQYRIENKDRKKTHKVGLRFLLDTLIGENDAPTFTVPGVPGLVDTKMDFLSLKIPDFIQALEKPNIKDPGIIAQVSFRKGSKLELPSRVSLTHWPGDMSGVDKEYDIPLRNINDRNEDSAIVVYWKEEEMKPGMVRNLGFTFGLGTVTSTDGLIGLSVGGSFAPGGELTVVALIHEAKPNQTVTLHLPPEFTLVPGSDKTQKVPAGQKGSDGRLRPSPVTWHIRSTIAGSFMFEVESNTNSRQKQRVAIKTSTLF
jgi:hypothetical protein